MTIRCLKDRVSAVVATVLAASVLSACTFVPSDDQPQTINSKNVPFNLLGKHPVVQHR